jgi:hypothetical protein
MTQILNRARLLPTAPGPAQRIAAVARKVRRSAALATAQQSFRDLQMRYSTLRDEQRRLIADLQAEGEEAYGSGPLVRRIRDLDTELSSLSEQSREAMGALFAAREPFARAVADALSPERRSSASRALVAAEALCVEFNLLDVGREISSAGGQPAAHPLLKWRSIIEPTLARPRKLVIE